MLKMKQSEDRTRSLGSKTSEKMCMRLLAATMLALMMYEHGSPGELTYTTSGPVADRCFITCANSRPKVFRGHFPDVLHSSMPVHAFPW
jgi:hypothetical protein